MAMSQHLRCIVDIEFKIIVGGFAMFGKHAFHSFLFRFQHRIPRFGGIEVVYSSLSFSIVYLCKVILVNKLTSKGTFQSLIL